MIQIHELKTWPRHFAALVAGSKTFELRKDDRGFKVGDCLELREWDPETQAYTGRSTWRTISHILPASEAPQDSLREGFAVLGLEEVEA